jgi:DNA-binding Lrp family transcriptional regulator
MMVKCGADVSGANTFPKALDVTPVEVLRRLERLDEEEVLLAVR